MEQEKVSVKNVFSEEEMVELGKELGQIELEKLVTEDDKKSAMRSYKNQIDALNVRINRLSNNLNDGFEIMDVLCDVELDFARKIRKYYQVHDGEFVKEEPLHKEDYQLNMLSQEPITSVKDNELY